MIHLLFESFYKLGFYKPRFCLTLNITFILFQATMMPFDIFIYEFSQVQKFHFFHRSLFTSLKLHIIILEGATGGVLSKKDFLKKFAKFTCASISILIKLQALAQVVSCEFLQNTSGGYFCYHVMRRHLKNHSIELALNVEMLTS